jgi:hypothetical protein
MADNEFLNWELPSGDLTAAQITAFQENYQKAFEYYLTEAQGIVDDGGASAPASYLQPGDSEPTAIVDIRTVRELIAQVNSDPRYIKSQAWVDENLVSGVPSDSEQIIAAMGGSENTGALGQKLYKEFASQKIEDEGEAARDLAGPVDEGDVTGGGDIHPDDIQAHEDEVNVDEEEEARKAQAAKAAKAEAERQVALIDDLQVAHFDEKHFIQSNLVNLIGLKLNVVDFYESKAFPYIDGKPNACIMMQGDPFNFMNLLSIYPTDIYHNLPSSEIANLQPKIRLYKMVKNDDGEPINVPIHFDTSFTSDNLESLLTNKRRRAVGVGIKSFSIDYTGVDSFSMHKSFHGTLKIYAASLGELFKPRYDYHTGVSYSYADLALIQAATRRQGCSAPAKARDLSQYQYVTDVSTLDFQIKLQLGISPLSAISAAQTKYAGALQRNSVTFVMKAVEHTFKYLQQNGAVELTIKYMPYIEDRFAGTDYNVLTDRESIKYKLKRELYAKIAAETGNSKLDAKHLKERIEEERKINTAAAANLITEAACASKIRYLPLDGSIVQEFMEVGPNLDWGKLIKLAPYAAFVGKEGNQEALKKDIAKAATNTSKKFRGPLQTGFTTPLTSSARFIYLCDLVDLLMAKMTKANSAGEMQTILEQLLEKDSDIKKFNETHPDVIKSLIERFADSSQDFAQLRVVLGPIEIFDPGDPANNIRIVSLGDLPIPIALLLEYMVKMAGEKHTKHFDFATFITHLIQTTITNWLNDDSAFDGTLNQNVSIHSTTITAFDAQYGKDDLTQALVALNNKLKRASPAIAAAAAAASNTPSVGEVKRIHAHRLYISDLPRPALDSAPGKDLEDSDVQTETSFLVFYSTPATPIEDMYTANPEVDAAAGIQHYMLGKDRGIIKDAQLSVRKDNGGMKALKFTQSGNAGLSQLHEIYDVNIKTYANLNIWPGATIYVDPRGWVPDLDPETREIYGNIRALDDLGLGGYYKVIKTSHTFERGNFESRIDAQWFANGGTGPKLSDTARSSPADAPLNKCGVEGTVDERHDARKLALAGTYGVQELARYILQEMGDFGDNPPPSSNDTN